MNIKKNLLVILLFLLTNNYSFLSYAFTTSQGKFIVDGVVKKLAPGMSKKKVEYILGSPNIIDPFFKSQWYYIFQYYSKDKLKRKNLTLLFVDDRLVKITGNYKVFYLKS